MTCLDPSEVSARRDWSISLTGEGGHFTEEAVIEGARLVGLCTCNHCGLTLPDTGPELQDAMHLHLIGCEDVPMELRSQVSLTTS
jgi:hypothetical protein